MRCKEKVIYTEDQKNQIRDSLERILIYYGAKPTNYNWNCIPHRHKKPDYDLSIKGKVCCCHCGLKGDSFNVISELEGLNIKKDFHLIIKKGLEIIGLNPTISMKYKNCKNIINGNSEIKFKNLNKFNLTNIILQNFKKSKKYTYFYKRNVGNKLIERYKIICENPKNIFPRDLLPQVNNLWAYQNIIPVWEERKVVNVILRRDDYLNTQNKKILNLKDLPLKIWNAGYIRHSQKNDSIFLTEGVFDGLSIESIDNKAIGLNSISMINKFLEIVEEFIDQLRENNVKFFICFDNDQRNQEKPNKKMPSEIAREKLDFELRKMGLHCFILKLNEYKDINEFHNKKPKTFKYEILKAIDFGRNVK